MRGGSDRAFLGGGLLDVVAARGRPFRHGHVQVKCKANAEPRLARAMLSRSLHSRCISNALQRYNIRKAPMTADDGK